jgi:hypothetical protein
MMIMEERLILGGNSSYALGNTATPTLTSANTGGSLTGNTGYGVGVVALTLDAYLNGSLAGGVPQTIARTNADSSTDTVNAARPIRPRRRTSSTPTPARRPRSPQPSRLWPARWRMRGTGARTPATSRSARSPRSTPC